MPMYRDFVPRAVRPWIYVLLAFCFQFSNGVYLGAMNQMIGQNAWMREDVLMCLYATLIGMAIYFPVLFRMKFHFSNKFLLCASAAVIIGCNLLVLLPLPRPVVWAVCVVCGRSAALGVRAAAIVGMCDATGDETRDLGLVRVEACVGPDVDPERAMAQAEPNLRAAARRLFSAEFGGPA